MDLVRKAYALVSLSEFCLDCPCSGPCPHVSTGCSSAKGYDGKAANQRKVALFPNASISFLPGTHNLPQEKTDAVASQICDFLVRGSSPANKL